MNSKRGFASDNNSGIHPRILKAIERANTGHWLAYGDDPFTASTINMFEIDKIAKFAHENGLLLHMDGARISNAAASLNLKFREFTRDTGVDILSFGGTNAVFVIIPRRYLDRILNKYFFYIWDENGPVVRLMTSFDTLEEDIENFVTTVKKAVKN